MLMADWLVGLISTRLDQKHNVKNIDLVKQQFNHSPHTVDQIQWMDQSAHKRQQLESRGGHVLRVRVGPSQGKKDVLIDQQTRLDSSKFGTKNRTEQNIICRRSAGQQRAGPLSRAGTRVWGALSMLFFLSA